MTPEIWMEDPFSARFELRLKIGQAMLFPERYQIDLTECLKEMDELTIVMKRCYEPDQLKNINRLLDLKIAATLRAEALPIEVTELSRVHSDDLPEAA